MLRRDSLSPEPIYHSNILQSPDIVSDIEDGPTIAKINEVTPLIGDSNKLNTCRQHAHENLSMWSRICILG